MNRDEAKAMLPILTAFAEGKTVQFYSKICEAWQDTDLGWLTADAYRIKPEPRLRAWTKGEIPARFIIRTKNGGGAFDRVARPSLPVDHLAGDDEIVIICGRSNGDNLHITPSAALAGWSMVDVDGTEHPCGILESTTEAAGEATT